MVSLVVLLFASGFEAGPHRIGHRTNLFRLEFDVGVLVIPTSGVILRRRGDRPVEQVDDVSLPTRFSRIGFSLGTPGHEATALELGLRRGRHSIGPGRRCLRA